MQGTQRYTMDIYDKLHPVGHLQIIKKHNSTGEEEVVFDEDNLICSGLGQSMAQFMSYDCKKFIPSGCGWTEGATIFQDRDAVYTVTGGDGDISFTFNEDGTTGSTPGEGDPAPSAIVCCCEEVMYVAFSVTYEEGVTSAIINITYGSGCVEKSKALCCGNTGQYKEMTTTDTRDANGNGTVTIFLDKCKGWGDCPITIPADTPIPGAGTDPCLFIWGQTGQGVTLSTHCEESDDNLCRDPGWLRSLVGAVAYGKRCGPTTGGGNRDKWCSTHPRNWEWEIENALENLMAEMGITFGDEKPEGCTQGA